jgi:hypothetical protein
MRIASIILLMSLMAFSWGCGGGGSSYKDRQGNPSLDPTAGDKIPAPNQPGPKR